MSRSSSKVHFPYMDKLTLRVMEISKADGCLPLHPRYLTLCRVWQIESLYIAGIASLNSYDIRALKEKIRYIEGRRTIAHWDYLDLSPNVIWNPPQSILDKFSWQTVYSFNIY